MSRSKIASVRTVQDWYDVWPQVAPGLRRRSAETVRLTHRQARGFKTAFGRRELTSITKAECAAWAAKNTNIPSGRHAKTFMGDAVLAGLLDESPFAGVRLQMTRTTRPEFIPSQQEVRALCFAADPVFADIIRIAAYSGLRMKEIQELRAQEVEIGLNGTIYLNVRIGKRSKDGKNKPRKAVVFGEGAVVARAMALNKHGVAFKHPKTGVAWTQKQISRRFIEARDLAGLPKACTFHCLRKFHCTFLLDLGVSHPDCAFQIGHVDSNGFPVTTLIRQIYGRPSAQPALDRIADRIAQAAG